MEPQGNGHSLNIRPNLGPQKFFPWVLPVLVVRQFSKLSCAISRKTNEPNLKK